MKELLFGFASLHYLGQHIPNRFKNHKSEFNISMYNTFPSICFLRRSTRTPQPPSRPSSPPLRSERAAAAAVADFQWRPAERPTPSPINGINHVSTVHQSLSTPNVWVGRIASMVYFRLIYFRLVYFRPVYFRLISHHHISPHIDFFTLTIKTFLTFPKFPN